MGRGLGVLQQDLLLDAQVMRRRELSQAVPPRNYEWSSVRRHALRPNDERRLRRAAHSLADRGLVELKYAFVETSIAVDGRRAQRKHLLYRLAVEAEPPVQPEWARPEPGSSIKAARYACVPPVTQSELAQAASIHPVSLSRIERGVRRPSSATLHAIVSAIHQILERRGASRLVKMHARRELASAMSAVAELTGTEDASVASEGM